MRGGVGVAALSALGRLARLASRIHLPLIGSLRLGIRTFASLARGMVKHKGSETEMLLMVVGAGRSVRLGRRRQVEKISALSGRVGAVVLVR